MGNDNSGGKYWGSDGKGCYVTGRRQWRVLGGNKMWRVSACQVTMVNGAAGLDDGRCQVVAVESARWWQQRCRIVKQHR